MVGGLIILTLKAYHLVLKEVSKIHKTVIIKVHVLIIKKNVTILPCMGVMREFAVQKEH